MIKTTENVCFEYLDTEFIDEDLICDYCHSPLIDPVSTSCKHKFCRVCFENCVNKTGECVKAKCKNKLITLEDITPVTEPIVLNMLDQLLVKCSSCGTTGIPRGNFEMHATKLCPKTIVCCSAVDLNCSWTGTSDELNQHIATCAFEQIRPILSKIIDDHRQLKEQLQDISKKCSKTCSTDVNELQEMNQRLNRSLYQLVDELHDEKTRVNDLRNEIQQLKEIVTQDKREDQHEKQEIERIDERCNKYEFQICQLTDKINSKEIKFAYSNLELEKILSKFHQRMTIDLSKQQLFDRDMETIIQQALFEKECTKLDLCYNSFTSKGVSILADALKYNKTLEELDFHQNRVSDIGISSLASILSSNSSVLKALGLGANNITDKGAQYLAEMLKTNQTITWLALAGNQIGDYGVQSLTEALAHRNTSLFVLSLHVNKSISDASVEPIIYMLRNNITLKKLWIHGCSLSADGKARLREAAKLKQGFSLYL